MALPPLNAIRARSACATAGVTHAANPTTTVGTSRCLARTPAISALGQPPQHGLPDLGRLRDGAVVHVLRDVAGPVVVGEPLPARDRDEVRGGIAGAVGDDRIGARP